MDNGNNYLKSKHISSLNNQEINQEINISKTK